MERVENDRRRKTMLQFFFLFFSALVSSSFKRSHTVSQGLSNWELYCVTREERREKTIRDEDVWGRNWFIQDVNWTLGRGLVIFRERKEDSVWIFAVIDRNLAFREILSPVILFGKYYKY